MSGGSVGGEKYAVASRGSRRTRNAGRGAAIIRYKSGRYICI